jgi:hypothetical protein
MTNEERQDYEFYKLMQTQQHDVPSHLEGAIMNSIQTSKSKLLFPIKLSSIFIFSLLACLYVITALVATYYFPQLRELRDFQQLIFAIAIVYVLYELNDMFSSRVGLQ